MLENNNLLQGFLSRLSSIGSLVHHGVRLFLQLMPPKLNLVECPQKLLDSLKKCPVINFVLINVNFIKKMKFRLC